MFLVIFLTFIMSVKWSVNLYLFFYSVFPFLDLKSHTKIDALEKSKNKLRFYEEKERETVPTKENENQILAKMNEKEAEKI